MMTKPKGYEYWIETDDGYRISEDAPDWAVEALDDFFAKISESTKGNDSGVVVHY